MVTKLYRHVSLTDTSTVTLATTITNDGSRRMTEGVVQEAGKGPARGQAQNVPRVNVDVDGAITMTTAPLRAFDISCTFEHSNSISCVMFIICTLTNTWDLKVLLLGAE